MSQTCLTNSRSLQAVGRKTRLDNTFGLYITSRGSFPTADRLIATDNILTAHSLPQNYQAPFDYAQYSDKSFSNHNAVNTVTP